MPFNSVLKLRRYTIRLTQDVRQALVFDVMWCSSRGCHVARRLQVCRIAKLYHLLHLPSLDLLDSIRVSSYAIDRCTGVTVEPCYRGKTRYMVFFRDVHYRTFVVAGYFSRSIHLDHWLGVSTYILRCHALLKNEKLSRRCRVMSRDASRTAPESRRHNLARTARNSYSWGPRNCTVHVLSLTHCSRRGKVWNVKLGPDTMKARGCISRRNEVYQVFPTVRILYFEKPKTCNKVPPG